MSKHPIYLTSFENSKNLNHSEMSVWSAAVYQPKGFNYPKVKWADIRDDSGKWIRPREFVGPEITADEIVLSLYKRNLMSLYADRIDEIRDWYRSRGMPVALCCWCPYERAAQRQLQQFGSFVCHLGVVGEFLSNMDIPVWYDADRLRMAVLPIV